jgi:hypothetical protein
MIRGLSILHNTPKPNKGRTQTEDCDNGPDVHESRVLLRSRRARDYVRVMIGEKVRREKALGLQRAQFPPGNWFAPPVEIGAAAEAQGLVLTDPVRTAFKFASNSSMGVSPVMPRMKWVFGR